MSRSISLFSDYRSGENSLTNYCGLIFKILYEENPKSFEEVLGSLLPSNTNLTVGVNFLQQTKQKKSIPDLAITQRSFTVFFETKLANWFYEKQTYEHIKGFQQETQDKILFLLSNFESDEPEKLFTEQIKRAWSEDRVILQPISFEELLKQLKGVRSSESFKKIIDEFEIYLDANNVLPKWKYLLDVVNCAGSIYQEIEANVYICPDTGGSYSHRRAKYLGPYSNKRVTKIFEVRAVVSIQHELGEGNVKWNNSGEPEQVLIEDAREIIRRSEFRSNENKPVQLQVFLLVNGEPTCFEKKTPGGMLGSKKYFWDMAIDCKNSHELAKLLDGKSWKDFQN